MTDANNQASEDMSSDEENGIEGIYSAHYFNLLGKKNFQKGYLEIKISTSFSNIFCTSDTTIYWND